MSWKDEEINGVSKSTDNALESTNKDQAVESSPAPQTAPDPWIKGNSKDTENWQQVVEDFAVSVQDDMNPINWEAEVTPESTEISINPDGLRDLEQDNQRLIKCNLYSQLTLIPACAPILVIMILHAVTKEKSEVTTYILIACICSFVIGILAGLLLNIPRIKLEKKIRTHLKSTIEYLLSPIVQGLKMKNEAIHLNQFDHRSTSPKTRDPMKLSVSSDLLNTLYLGQGNKWNNTEIGNDIKGTYHHVKFRFLDMDIGVESQKNKYTYFSRIFQGQVFIFPLKENIPYAVQYEFKQNSRCRSLRDFNIAINRSIFDPKRDVFEDLNDFSTTSDQKQKKVPYKSYKIPDMPQDAIDAYFKHIESESLVKAMIQLGQLLKEHKWVIRLHHNRLILIIGRKKTMFEPYKEPYKSDTGYSIEQTQKDLAVDLQEFIRILNIITPIDRLKVTEQNP